MQSLALATEAMVISSSLRDRPAALPSAVSRAQTSAACSSNGGMRDSACAPSEPANQAHQERCAFFPLVSPRCRARFRRWSASSLCLLIQPSSDFDGFGLITFLIMLVSRK